MDVEGAFDNTSLEAIERAAEAKEIQGEVVSLVLSMLDNRKLTVEMNGTKISLKTSRGCPQGSILGPLLWLLVIDRLLVRLTAAGYLCHGYADDIVITVRGKFVNTLSETLQGAIKIVESWCSEEGLSINPDKTSLILHTKSRSRKLARCPVLFGRSIELSNEVKYLGVIIDEKLNWKSNLDHRIDKATKTFWLLRRALGSTWGLSPRVVMWFYRMIVLPYLCHGCVVWWKRSKILSDRRQLDSLQRLATSSITGCLRNTPTRALEALLDLPSLEMVLMSTAEKTAVRLNINDLWEPRSEGVNGHTQGLAVSTQSPSYKLCDWMATEHNFDRNFNVLIHSKEEWTDSQQPPVGLLDGFWYTDGAKNEISSGAGVYRENPPAELSYALDEFTSVFQAEVFAIMKCVEIADAEQCINITICTDSQAALKALMAGNCNSRILKECYQALARAAEKRVVNLVWVPGHSNILGNDQADRLAREGSNLPMIGPKPALPVPLAHYKMDINQRMRRDMHQAWRLASGCQQAKAFIGNPCSKTAFKLLRLSRPDISLVTGILTGHNRLNYHLNKIGIKSEPDCDMCGAARETSEHFIRSCPAFALIRNKIFGNHYLMAEEIKDADIGKILRFTKESARFSRSAR